LTDAIWWKKITDEYACRATRKAGGKEDLSTFVYRTISKQNTNDTLTNLESRFNGKKQILSTYKRSIQLKKNLTNKTWSSQTRGGWVSGIFTHLTATHRILNKQPKRMQNQHRRVIPGTSLGNSTTRIVEAKQSIPLSLFL
jgi:hypothetical protein